MNKISYTVFVPILMLLLAASCGKKEKKSVYEPYTFEKSNTELLFDKIHKFGDISSKEKFPYLIDAKDVMASLDSNMLVLDLRNPYVYSQGHIKGAVNIKLSEAADYARAAGLPMYDKVVMVCYSGQTASYAAGVLHALGYQNVYAMYMGMASWNKKFADRWEKKLDDRFVRKLVDTPFSAPDTTYELPTMEVKRPAGEEILKKRAQKMLAENFSDLLVSIGHTLKYADKIHLMAYLPKELYQLKHPEGAVLYTSGNFLSDIENLRKLPSDKTLVLLSSNGQESAFYMAYLKILGYNAKSMKYGLNYFMYSYLLDAGYNNKAFTSENVNNFPFETSEYVEVEGEVLSGGC